MKSYKVDLNIIAPKEIEEDEICSIFDNIVYFIDDKTIHKNKIWIFDFELNQEFSIEKQVEIIGLHVSKDKLKNLLLKNIKVEFDVRIYYDTYTCSFALSSRCLSLGKKIVQDIEFNFSLYPTDFQKEK